MSRPRHDGDRVWVLIERDDADGPLWVDEPDGRMWRGDVTEADNLPDSPALPALARWLATYPAAGAAIRRRHALGVDPYVYDGQPEGQYGRDCAVIEALLAALGPAGER